MDVLIFGGSGFIGRHLFAHLQSEGHTPWILSRSNRHKTGFRTFVYSPERIAALLNDNCTSPYAIVNLAGESIDAKRWTPEQKEKILQSRVRLTKALTQAIAEVRLKPSVLINASAVGYYGYSESGTYTEKDGPGEGFLPEVTRQWEGAAQEAEAVTRTAVLRFGVVLGRDGGALPRMVLPYRFFAGGRVGSGRQWVSWIHIRDVCRIVSFLLNRDHRGVFNAVSPAPVRMNEFGKTIARVLRRPHWLPVPGAALRAMMGDGAEIVLQGQNVLPERLLESGFAFSFETLEEALRDLLK